MVNTGKKNLGAEFTFTKGAITLNAPDEKGLSTEGKTAGWFWFNSLPVVDGNGTEATEVIPVFETSYGQVTAKKSYDGLGTNYTVKDCAYALNIEDKKPVWHPLANDKDDTKKPTVWALTGAKAPNTFINQYGNHKGKYSIDVDFSKGVMNGMHIKSDKHLQTALKYYIASGKTESPVVLNLDKEADGNFSISKISIALIQTIQGLGHDVKVQACTAPKEKPAKIVITQKDQTGELAKATEVPTLNKVFAVKTDVYLSSDCEWTWGGGADGTKHLAADKYVKSITNEGTLTVNATNLQVSYDGTKINNAKGATMNITQVTTVKNALTNLGFINVGSDSNTAAELRAYGVEIKNDATKLDEYGEIYNHGVVGVSAGAAGGSFNNYGYIQMMSDKSITLLSSNQTGGATFGAEWAAGNKMGIVELPKGNALAIVSVSNATNQGFIKYNWTGKTYETPKGNVKYNTIIVSDDITFTKPVDEIQYIEFAGERTQVINPAAANKLTALKGIYVHTDCSIIIEKTNILDCEQGAFLGTDATVYKGGDFKKNGSEFGVDDAKAANNYFGGWSLDQIVEY